MVRSHQGRKWSATKKLPSTHRAQQRWESMRCQLSIPIRCASMGRMGLRVVDTSVMPNITNGNIYAPVMMIAEKAADLILGNTPLPHEQVDWYRNNG